MPTATPLRTELLECILSGTPLTDGAFDRLALRVFAHQYRCNDAYRAFCDRRGANPAVVNAWEQIPAVPTDAFKAAPLVCGDPSDAIAVFETSGTTAGSNRRGHHYFSDLTLYNAAARAGFVAHLVPEGHSMRMLSLVPSPATAPHSSLSHMVGEVMAQWGIANSAWYVNEHGMDWDRLDADLRTAETSQEPICILATSFALVHLLDHLRAAERQFRLPPRSRVMDTGGFKGRSREVPRERLYAEITAQLGVGAAWCINEYGMTEMSSQFYDGVAGNAGTGVGERLYHPPPWLRTRAVDPETLHPLPPGQRGVLRHWDLANLDSVAVLQTADLGAVYTDGFRVIGRASGAEARGCSIAMDELLLVLGGGAAPERFA